MSDPQPESNQQQEQPKQTKTILQEEIMEKIMTIDQSNKTCVDCNTNGSTFISINQGVTVCDKCAVEHRALGYTISYLVSLSGPWDSYLLDFILKGGNSKFNAFITEYGIKTFPIKEKYNTKACDFYRRNLKANVMHLGSLTKKLENGADIDYKCRNVFPEFEGYTINLSELEGKHKFFGFFKNIGSKIKAQTNEGVERISQTSFGMAMKEAGEVTGNQFKKATGFMKEKTTSFGEKMKGTFSNIASKIKKDTPAKKEEATQEKQA